MQNKLEIALSSSTTWVLLATIVYNALNVNAALLPQGWSVIVNLVLLGLGSYLHANHVQTAAATGSTH